MIATILRSAKSLKDIDILNIKLSQQPGQNLLKNKTISTLKFHSMCHILNRYTSNIFAYDILFIKVIKYMLNNHLSVRRILNKTSTFAHCSENRQV